MEPAGPGAGKGSKQTNQKKGFAGTLVQSARCWLGAWAPGSCRKPGSVAALWDLCHSPCPPGRALSIKLPHGRDVVQPPACGVKKLSAVSHFAPRGELAENRQPQSFSLGMKTDSA